jgi:hypothetical protein
MRASQKTTTSMATSHAAARRPNGRMQHPTVRVRHGKLRARIDAEIAPLVGALWQRGILTQWSCQDVSDSEADESRRGTAMLAFPDTENAVAFLNATTVFEPGGMTLYNRMTCQGCRGVGCWGFEVYPMDAAYSWRSDSYAGSGRPDYYFRITVFFPATDIPVLVARLEGSTASAGRRNTQE